MSLRLSLNNEDFASKPIIPSQQLQKGFEIKYKGDPDELYTLFMYNPDASYPEDLGNSYFLHYLVVNIHSDNITTGDILAPYQAPDPPQDSNPHEYIVGLYRQPKLIPQEKITKRTAFSVSSFITKYGLDLSGYFLVVSPK